MNITGIITEYNPFHNGHLYQIKKAKELGASHIVVIMSGDFVQRGAPAIIDKYARTQMALSCGADLVIELPVCFATSGAQYFARGAVAILDSLGIIDTLTFGCETTKHALLEKVAAYILEEPAEYKEIIHEELKKGNSFPKAREIAIEKNIGKEASSLLSSPNNILALEYIMAIKLRNSKMTISPILREGNAYHETCLSEGIYASASAIRNVLTKHESFSDLKEYVPDTVFSILHNAYGKSFPVFTDDFSFLLQYALFQNEHCGYTKYADIHSDFSDKIKNALYTYSNWEELCNTLKSKDITYTKISRALTHVLLNVCSSDLEDLSAMGYAPYARILGLGQKGKELLSLIKKNSSLPIIIRVKEDMQQLDDMEKTLFEKDIFASHLYQSVISKKFNIPFQNEFQRKLIQIETGSYT